MLRRLRGLLIVLRVLSPVLLVIGLVLATWWMAAEMTRATRDYGDKLSRQLDEIQAAIDEANEGLEAIAGFVVTIAGAAEDLLGKVAGLPTELTIPLPEVEIPDFEIPIIDQTIDLPDFTIGDVDIPIPGVEALQGLAGDLAAAGETVVEPVVKIAGLSQVPPHLEQAAEDTVLYAGEVRATMSGWLRIVLALLALGVVVWLLAQARPALAELGRGLGMLAGRTPVRASDVADLERQVRELQRRVSAL